MGNNRQHSYILFLETIKDIQSLEFFISAFPFDQLSHLNIIVGPLVSYSLKQSPLFSRLACTRPYVKCTKFSMCSKNPYLSGLIFDLLLFLAPFLLLAKINPKYIDLVWLKYISFVGYEQLYFSRMLNYDLLIPWRKITKQLYYLLDSLNLSFVSVDRRSYLVPHSPIYDQRCFEMGAFANFKLITAIIPHPQLYAMPILLQIPVLLIPSIQSLHINFPLLNSTPSQKPTVLNFLYLAQKVTRYPDVSQEPWTFQELEQTRKHIRDFFDSANLLSLKVKLILRLPLQMCNGDINSEDFSEFSNLHFSNDKLLFDDIFSSDFCIAEFTSAVKYASILRPSLLLRTTKYSNKTLSDDKLKYQYDNLHCIQAENLNYSSLQSLISSK